MSVTRTVGQRWLVTALLLALPATSTLLAASSTGKKVEFNRDIRPILSDNCFACHGPDEKKRKGKFRLDTRDGALTKRDQGQPIVPKSAKTSLVYQRIISKDADEVMPPPESHKKLTPEQVSLIKRWIDDGAEYQGHWSFIPPQSPELPKVKDSKWPQGALDRFILATLETKGLKPSAQASKENLIRRVTIDLTG
ncbi:MAG TPA: c-type cytochrome domain-containing protein, partial [Candidatus Eisenbacteria bacterium]|nr:c-type cytochrome domain-containing protein [Candidatus Eisenbacteria bacterium]